MSQGSILMSSDSPRYDDDQWHTITASHDVEGLKLSVDDYETFSNPTAASPPSFKYGSLLVGGVPSSYFVSLSKVGTSSPFVGCIADVTFNGALINFANSTEYDGVTIGRCSEADADEAAIIPHAAPSIPTEDEVLDKMPKFPLPPAWDGDGSRKPPEGIDEEFSHGRRGEGVEGGIGRGKDGSDGRGGGRDSFGPIDRDKDGYGGTGDRDRDGIGAGGRDRDGYGGVGGGRDGDRDGFRGPGRDRDGGDRDRDGFGGEGDRDKHKYGEGDRDRFGAGEGEGDRHGYGAGGRGGFGEGEGDRDRHGYGAGGTGGFGEGEGDRDRHGYGAGGRGGFGEGEGERDRHGYGAGGTGGFGEGEGDRDRHGYGAGGRGGFGEAEGDRDRHGYGAGGRGGFGEGEGDRDRHGHAEGGRGGFGEGAGDRDRHGYGAGGFGEGEGDRDGHDHAEGGRGGFGEGESDRDRHGYGAGGRGGFGEGEGERDRHGYGAGGAGGFGEGEGDRDRHGYGAGGRGGFGEGEVGRDRHGHAEGGRGGFGEGAGDRDRHGHAEGGRGGFGEGAGDRDRHGYGAGGAGGFGEGEGDRDRHGHGEGGRGGFGEGESGRDRHGYGAGGRGGFGEGEVGRDKHGHAEGGLGGFGEGEGDRDRHGYGIGGYGEGEGRHGYGGGGRDGFGEGSTGREGDMGGEFDGSGIIGRVDLDGGVGGKKDSDTHVGEGGRHAGGVVPGKDRGGVHVDEDGVEKERGHGVEGEREIDNELDGRGEGGGQINGRGHADKMGEKGKKHKKPMPTPKPTPFGLCALPLDPASDPDATFQNGYRFGTQNGSRIEFSSLSGRNKNVFDYSLDFKTSYPDGLLFYASDKGHIDFAALYIKGGKLFFGFNCGSGAALITSPDSYDDGNWHTVRITRENTLGQLIVDGQNPVSGESSGSTKTLNVIPPYYLGGFDPAIIESAKHNIQGLNQSFAGCVRKFQANNKDVKPSLKKGVVPCSEHTEPGVFFASGGGFVRAVDSFRVGTNIEIKMQIKPRSTSGVLLAVHGKKDYLFLQMVNGVIEFTVDNGRGPFTSAYKPGDEYFFCDGRWHFIHAVQAKNVIVLSVDSFSVEPGIGTPGSTVTDTKHPLYLGGAGPRGHKLRGNLTSHQYVGCMREVLINSNLLKISTHRAIGNVTVSSCPTI
ncbi:hypothetical protein RUM44_010273 [Polyplax serrata]|uniref:Laminin G domain-containing protein n=1 Tax=Polyplax serrata TaxID=468196 RepID=A0ABR1AV20_POLSC